MGYSPWGHKESDTTKRLTFSLSLMNGSLLLRRGPSSQPRLVGSPCLGAV